MTLSLFFYQYYFKKWTPTVESEGSEDLTSRQIEDDILELELYYNLAEREFESQNSDLSEIDSLSKEEIKIRLKNKLQKLDRDMAEIRLLLGGVLNQNKLKKTSLIAKMIFSRVNMMRQKIVASI